MNRVLRILGVLVLLGVLSPTAAGGMFVLLSPARVVAQVPPTKAPAATPTDEATEEPTQEPTQEPTEEPTEEPTQEPTQAPPTNTPVAPPPRETRPPRQKPNPDCQSRVEGDVHDATGQQVNGATVVIEGDGWSSGMLTDDGGHFGFSGLCAGSAIVRPVLPDGQVGDTSTVSLDGKNNLYLDLNFMPAGAAAPAEATVVSEQTPTPEAGMPVTGYSGWSIAGGALLAVLLMVSAGARRVLGSTEQS